MPLNICRKWGGIGAPLVVKAERETGERGGGFRRFATLINQSINKEKRVVVKSPVQTHLGLSLKNCAMIWNT